VKITGQFVLVILGPTGVGKSTIIQELTKKTSQFEIPRSYTTRPSRPNDSFLNIVSVSKKDYYRIRRTGVMLIDTRYTYGKFSQLNGLTERDLKEVITKEKIPVFDLSLSTLRTLRKKTNLKLLSIYLLPPSKTELVKRIKKRYAGGPTKKHLIARIKKAISETEKAKKIKPGQDIDFILINNRLDTVTKTIIELCRHVSKN